MAAMKAGITGDSRRWDSIHERELGAAMERKKGMRADIGTEYG